MVDISTSSTIIFTQYLDEILSFHGLNISGNISLEYTDIYPFIEGYLIVNFIRLNNG